MRTEPNERVVDAYGRAPGSLRPIIVKVVRKREGDEFLSPTLREIFRRHHGVDVGMYTHGGCFIPWAFGPGTSIGRYSSVAHGAFAATDNHPMHYKSMHGYFFNPSLGVTDKEWEFSPLSIGNDVWLGHNSIIMPSVDVVGDGAVIAAGAVVNKDVPPYAVVAGNPGRVVRYRFEPETIARLLAEKWWERDLEDLRSHLDEFTGPYGPGSPSARATDAAQAASSLLRAT